MVDTYHTNSVFCFFCASTSEGCLYVSIKVFYSSYHIRYSVDAGSTSNKMQLHVVSDNGWCRWTQTVLPRRNNSAAASSVQQ